MAGIRRRSLLRAGATLVAAAGLPRLVFGQTPPSGLVVSMGGGGSGESGVSRYLAPVLEALQRTQGAPAALKQLLPSEGLIGIKVSCLGAPKSSVSVALVETLIDLLAAAGISGDRLLVFDQFGERMIRSGFALGRRGDGVTVMDHQSGGWATTGPSVGGHSMRWAKAFLKCATIINVCVPKDHRYIGVSGALTNMALGNVDNPAPLHERLDSAVPALFGAPEIQRRLCLHVCDATSVLYQGGPQDQPAHRAPWGGLLASVDPVALDWAILELVNGSRSAAGLPLVQDVKRPRKRPPSHLRLAARRGLGAAADSVRWMSRDATGNMTHRPMQLVAGVPLPRAK